MKKNAYSDIDGFFELLTFADEGGGKNSKLYGDIINDSSVKHFLVILHP